MGGGSQNKNKCPFPMFEKNGIHYKVYFSPSGTQMAWEERSLGSKKKRLNHPNIRNKQGFLRGMLAPWINFFFFLYWYDTDILCLISINDSRYSVISSNGNMCKPQCHLTLLWDQLRRCYLWSLQYHFLQHLKSPQRSATWALTRAKLVFLMKFDKATVLSSVSALEYLLAQ